MRAFKTHARIHGKCAMDKYAPKKHALTFTSRCIKHAPLYLDAYLQVTALQARLLMAVTVRESEWVGGRVKERHTVHIDRQTQRGI